MFPGSESAASLSRGRLVYFPVAPGRLEFAAGVRRAVVEHRPDLIAVELPESLSTAYRRAVARLPQISVLLYQDDTDQERAIYVPVEPADPFTEAIRTAGDLDLPLLFIEPETSDRPHVPDNYPDPYAIQRIGLGRYVEAYRLHPQPRTEEIEEHAAGIAWKLQGADPDARILVVLALNMLDPVLDAMEMPQEEPARGRKRTRLPSHVQLLNPHPDCLAEIAVEYPFLQQRYETFRTTLTGRELIDRLRSQYDLFREAETSYGRNAGEKIEHWQRKLLARYSRNLAMISGELVACLFDLTVAAKSVVDDNYAWEVWEQANRYSAQRASAEVETVNLSGEEVWLNSRKLRLRRRLPRPKRRLRPSSLKRRKKENFPGEWARQLDGNAICSYPPEDLVVEDYGRFLKRKAKSMLSEERSRTEPFSTSMLDGIDLRETLRNWHQGRIYVRQMERVAGEVGAVVVIFDEDRENRYWYLTTWLGENQNESDMAFYSTYPWDKIVGPGIGRAEYGGFLMSLPPRRMADVWTDPDYDFAETKAERLLMAGLDYSIQRFVVYVAARPPRSIFRSIASHLNRSILYLPMGQLSPARLKRLRVVHVLDSHERRKEAAGYIW